jgi:hypothetical protein
MGSDHVCLLGKTGSDRRTVKVTRLTRTGHWPPSSEPPTWFENSWQVHSNGNRYD